MTFVGIVVARRFFRVAEYTAMEITEPNALMEPERPPAVPISSCVRSGKVVVAMLMHSIEPMSRQPVMINPMVRFMSSGFAAAAASIGAEADIVTMMKGF